MLEHRGSSWPAVFGSFSDDERPPTNGSFVARLLKQTHYSVGYPYLQNLCWSVDATIYFNLTVQERYGYIVRFIRTGGLVYDRMSGVTQHLPILDMASFPLSGVCHLISR